MEYVFLGKNSNLFWQTIRAVMKKRCRFYGANYREKSTALPGNEN